MKDAKNFSISNLKYSVFGKMSNLISKSLPLTKTVLSVYFFLILKSLKTLQKNIFVYIIHGQIWTLQKTKKMELLLIQRN
jgi:hypothetical protein